jgi:hypothetical protein
MSHDELSLRSNDVARCGVISLGRVDCMYSPSIAVPAFPVASDTGGSSAELRCFLRI